MGFGKDSRYCNSTNLNRLQIDNFAITLMSQFGWICNLERSKDYPFFGRQEYQHLQCGKQRYAAAVVRQPYRVGCRAVTPWQLQD